MTLSPPGDLGIPASHSNQLNLYFPIRSGLKTPKPEGLCQKWLILGRGGV